MILRVHDVSKPDDRFAKAEAGKSVREGIKHVEATIPPAVGPEWRPFQLDTAGHAPCPDPMGDRSGGCEEVGAKLLNHRGLGAPSPTAKRAGPERRPT